MGALGFVSEIRISTRFSSQTVGNCRMLWHWGFDTTVEKNKKRRGKKKRNKRNLKYSYDEVAWCWARFTPRSRSLGPSPGQTRSLFWVHGQDNFLAQECKWLGKGCSWQICSAGFAYMAPRCHGGSYAGLCADSCSNHGYSRCVSGSAFFTFIWI